MGLKPKYKLGEYVIDLRGLADGTERLMLIESRSPSLEGYTVNWTYKGPAFFVKSKPIELKYSSTITRDEKSILSLESRTVMHK